MAHSIRFTYNHPAPDCILTEDEIRDLIELLYRWGDSNFHIIFNKKHKRWRGSAEWHPISREHEINLYVETIRGDFARKIFVGGSQVAQSERAAMAMVLAHELQHCNQVRLHKQDANSTFYGGHRYWNLASEREARNFVDERLNEICAYFGLPPQMRRATVGEAESSGELDEVISLLAECDTVSPEDVNDELRASNILKPANVAYVRRILAERGVEVKKREKVYFR